MCLRLARRALWFVVWSGNGFEVSVVQCVLRLCVVFFRRALRFANAILLRCCVPPFGPLVPRPVPASPDPSVTSAIFPSPPRLLLLPLASHVPSKAAQAPRPQPSGYLATLLA